MIPVLRTAATASLAVALLSACSQPVGNATDQFMELGTLVEVTVRDDAAQQLAFGEVRRVFATAQVDWYAWNINGPGNPDAGGLLDRARELERLSDGLFDPGIGALVELWGFHDGERPPGPPPEAAAIAGWRELPVVTDLGAIGKGAAITLALQALRETGIDHALINAGGDLAVIGDAGDRPWRIGIRDPRGPGVFAGVELISGEAVFTSGDYERMFEWDGVRYHHILDPRTGYPAIGTISVTVIHTDAALADAAATALFVAGDGWPSVAMALGVREVMRVKPDGSVELTPVMAERLRFEIEPPNIKVIADDVASR